MNAIKNMSAFDNRLNYTQIDRHISTLNKIRNMLWQPLDQCLIAAQAVNLIEGISSGNMSCIFIRELNREPQQYSTYYLYKVSMVCAMTVYCFTLMSMPCPYGHYLSTICLPQD